MNNSLKTINKTINNYLGSINLLFNTALIYTNNEFKNFNRYLNENITFILILILIVIVTHFILLKKNKVSEGFNVEDIGNIMTKIKDGIVNLPAKVEQTYQSASSLADKAGGLTTKITELPSVISDQYKLAADAIDTQITGNPVFKGVTSAINTIDNQFNTIGSQLTSIGPTITGGVSDILDKVSVLGDEVKNVGPTIKGKLDEAVSSASQGVTSSISSVQSIGGTIGSELSGVGDKIAGVEKIIGDEFKGALSSLSDGITPVISNIESAGSLITKEVKGIGKQIDGIGKTITTGVTDAATTVETGVLSGVKTIEETGKRVTKEIDEKFMEFIKLVEETVKTVVIDKLLKFFDQIPGILNKAIVDPFTTLFTGLGDVFVEIFNIFRLIGDKITNLPSCVPAYGIQGTLSGVDGFLRYFIPGWIVDYMELVYKYTIKVIFDWTGITKWMDGCVGFDVSSEVDKMNDTFKNISNTFISDFGNIPPITF